LKPETVGGCGLEIGFNEEYRCVDCSVVFHTECLRRHFDKKLTEADIENEVMP